MFLFLQINKWMSLTHYPAHYILKQQSKHWLKLSFPIKLQLLTFSCCFRPLLFFCSPSREQHSPPSTLNSWLPQWERLSVGRAGRREERDLLSWAPGQPFYTFIFFSYSTSCKLQDFTTEYKMLYTLLCTCKSVNMEVKDPSTRALSSRADRY